MVGQDGEQSAYVRKLINQLFVAIERGEIGDADLVRIHRRSRLREDTLEEFSAKLIEAVARDPRQHVVAQALGCNRKTLLRRCKAYRVVGADDDWEDVKAWAHTELAMRRAQQDKLRTVGR